MPRYCVPDTSVLASALLRDAFTDRARPLVEAIVDGGIDAIIPDLGPAEFLNVCRKRRSSTPASTLPLLDVAVERFLELPIVWWPISSHAARAAWSLHKSDGIGTWDAFFLACAMDWGAELWTTDSQLFTRARRLHAPTFDLKSVAFV